MARLPRPDLAGVPQHVVQNGVRFTYSSNTGSAKRGQVHVFQNGVRFTYSSNTGSAKRGQVHVFRSR